MANRKISELPLINTLSGSNSGGTVIPVVVGGTTAQISAENFSRFMNLYAAQTGSANTFTATQTITQNLIVNGTTAIGGNATIGGTLVVAGKLTAEEFHTEITSASIIYSSGSTKFGDDTGDKHQFTGSINLSGSLLYNGVTLLNIDANTVSRLQQATASLQQATASLQANSASVNAQLLAIQQTTQSLQVATASLQAFSSSVNSQLERVYQTTQSLHVATASLQFHSASVDAQLLRLQQTTQSLQVATASLQAFSSSVNDQLQRVYQTTQSLHVATASIQLQTASLLAFTASQDSRNFTLSEVTASFNYFYQATASLQAFSSSQADRNLILSTVTGSINQATASLQAFTASQDGRNLTLSIVTGSLIGITNGLMAFTAALDNTYATDAQLYQLYQATRSLELHSGSMVGVTNGLMEYTASLKGQAIVSSSTQIQNYDVFALNSNLYNGTGSIKGEIAGIEAYTSSLKAAISVSGTNVQIIGDLNVNKLNVQYISSSVLVTSGSNTFGDQSTDKHEFTGSVHLQNSLILGTEVLGNAGLNAISASTRIELNSIEEYTASLKTAAIVSSSTQVQNYDVFGLNSNLYNSTGSLIGITNGLMILTASLKSQSILSGSGLTNYVPIYDGKTALSSSIIFQSTGSIGTGGKGITIGSDVSMYKFAVNPIANTYFGIGYTETDSIFMTAVDNTYLPKPIVYAASSYKWYANSLTSTYNLTMVIQSASLNVGFGGIENPLHKVDISGSARVSNGMTVSGSLLASGSSHTIQNGYVILQQVSQSLNFVDDTAAAAGGVPLGGLYRNGNFIVIRIV
jgi:hypothetical protein